MGEASQAFEQAMQYALQQLSWYDGHSLRALYLFRFFGAVSILAAISVTYLAASLKSESELFLRVPKKNLIAILSALSALSISMSGFFAWDTAWMGYRTAQFQIEALVQEAKIERLQATYEKDEKKLFKASLDLTNKVAEIVAKETGRYFSTVKKGKPSGEPGSDK